MSAPASTTMAGATASPVNLASDLKTSSDSVSKPKPCCVCTSEKAARDECMLFSNSADPQKECASLVSQYKACMKGYGFNL